MLLAGCGKSKEELFSEAQKHVKEGNPGGAIVLLRNALEKDQNYLNARVELANAYKLTGKFEQAAKEYRKILAQDPGRSDMRIALASALNFSGKPDEAIAEAEAVLKEKPNSPDALEVMGIAFALKENEAAAEKNLLEAIRLGGKVSAKLELASLYAGLSREQDARRLLDDVITSDPKNTRGYYMLAQFEASRGNTDKAMEIYKTIIGIKPDEAKAFYRMGQLHIAKNDVAGAEKVADVMVQRFPKKGEGYRLKGLVQYHKKNYAEAITQLQNAVKLGPTVDGYYYLGLSLFNKGELENALSQFRKILDHDPSFTQARLLTGMILLNQKRIDDAVTEVNKVLQTDPKNAVGHNILGSALMAKGQYEEGMRELNKATSLDPKIVDAHMKKGIFNFTKGNLREAEADLATAVQVAPDILNSRLVLASYHLRQQNFGKALAVLQGGLKGDKDDAVLYNVMAAVQFAENKQPEAVKSLSKAKELNPAFYPAYFNLATYHASRNDYAGAQREYQAVVARDPKNVQALLRLAAVCQLKGQDAEALKVYASAKETNDPSVFAALAGYYLKKNDTSKALKTVEEGMKAIPRNPALMEMKGRLLAADEKYKEAVKAFDDLEEVAPDRGLPLKVAAYVAKKDIDKAVEQARRAVTLKPNSAQGYLLVASVYESQKDVARAIEEVKKGLAVDPSNVNALMALGALHEKRRELPQAQAVYQQVARKNPDYAPAIFAEGALLDASGQKKEAVRKYREALAKQDNFVPALNNLAYLYAEGYGSSDEALRMAINAFKQAPENSGIMDTLGYALMKSGKKADAVKVLERAASLMPNNPTVLYHYALACRDNGDAPKAAATLKKALQAGSFAEADMAKKVLAEVEGRGAKR